ncbi:MAG: cell wall shape-determining protein [Alphaproteobacteria bacterium]|jgi:rod shape determining protein RodA|nr:cell wall shape-determining protein [Alphaproteobacteria bacterium]MDF3033423.1 cell wall shape-determining protein [Alphaproteobacteria bacterium]
MMPFASRLSLLRQINPWVIGLLILIASIGFLMLYSAANGNMAPWAWKQMLRFSIGFVIMFVVALVDSRTWMAYAYPLYAVSLLLLLGVEVMGFMGKGAIRWIDLYIIQLQPSELMKIALILALGRYFHKRTLEEIRRLPTLAFPLALILMPTLLAMRQPDLGTAIILILCGSTIFFAAGVQWWKFAITGGSVLAAIPALWTLLHDYQKKRVLTFLNPENDPTNSGYHITQSKIALGSGGITGKGFLQGTQSHLNFLPEKQTDFIFTMFSEEFGLIGGIALLALYSALLAYGFQVAMASRNSFGRLVAIGMTTTVFLYVFINMAMVMGMLPVVGIPLPLISYGGTALLTLLIGQGLIFSVAIHHNVRMGWNP